MPLADQLTALYARRRFGINPGVERVRMTLERLGNPQRNFPVIHVVGTNGKGSTSSFLSSILVSSGLRTGLFTSPHLVEFTERFRINGTEISEAKLSHLIQAVLAVAPEEATFFEIVTAMAMLYFSVEQVDAAVVEAGMGGQSDATAACEGFMTLVTPVSLDHTDYLGKTVQEIAREKVAIARPGSLLLIGTQTPDVTDSLSAWCNEQHMQALRLEEAVRAEWNDDSTLAYHGINTSYEALAPGIRGSYQRDNAALALMAAECLMREGWKLTRESLQNGIADARWPGRMELIPGNPPLLLDGAHNQTGMEALSHSLNEMKTYGRILLVLGIMADKAVNAMVSSLPKSLAACYCVTPNIERAMESVHLHHALAAHGIPSRACGRVSEGIQCARHDAVPGDLIVVCGSLFTVGEAKAWLAGKLFNGIRG